MFRQLSAQDKGQDQKLKTVLQCTALTIKTVELAKNYLVHLKEDDLYLSGFVESPKLEEFLKYFHIISGSSYSVRRSKSKTKNDPEPEEKPLRKYKPGYLGKGKKLKKVCFGNFQRVSTYFKKQKKDCDSKNCCSFCNKKFKASVKRKFCYFRSNKVGEKYWYTIYSIYRCSIYN